MIAGAVALSILGLSALGAYKFHKTNVGGAVTNGISTLFLIGGLVGAWWWFTNH